MNRPDNLMAYDELDLKLGIKSSLPHVKGTLALSVLLWECADHPSELVFSEQKDKETVLTQVFRKLFHVLMIISFLSLKWKH